MQVAVVALAAVIALVGLGFAAPTSALAPPSRGQGHGDFFAKPGVGVGENVIRSELSGLPTGTSSTIRLVNSEAELDSLYGRLSQGGTPSTPAGYGGQGASLSDGTWVGLRGSSSSGAGPTIDIKFPGEAGQWKVHIAQGGSP